MLNQPLFDQVHNTMRAFGASYALEDKTEDVEFINKPYIKNFIKEYFICEVYTLNDIKVYICHLSREERYLVIVKGNNDYRMGFDFPIEFLHIMQQLMQ